MPGYKEIIGPAEVNTAMIAVCALSVFLNSVSYGVLRGANLYSNAFLISLWGLSTGAYTVLGSPELGARLGFFGSFFFTFAPHLKIFLVDRFFSTRARYGIGSFYMTYHGLNWTREHYRFEDAGEDAEDEIF